MELNKLNVHNSYELKNLKAQNGTMWYTIVNYVTVASQHVPVMLHYGTTLLN